MANEVLIRLYYAVMFKFHVEACAVGYAEVGNCPSEKVMDYIFEQSSDLYHAMRAAQQVVQETANLALLDRSTLRGDVQGGDDNVV